MGKLDEIVSETIASRRDSNNSPSLESIAAIVEKINETMGVFQQKQKTRLTGRNVRGLLKLEAFQKYCEERFGYEIVEISENGNTEKVIQWRSSRIEILDTFKDAAISYKKSKDGKGIEDIKQAISSIGVNIGQVIKPEIGKELMGLK